MGLWEFSQRDLLRGKVVPPAWYRVRIDDIGEALSKDQQSTNFPVEATIIKNADTGETEGVEGTPISWMFNSKALGFAVGFLTALGVTPEPGQRINYEVAKGKELDVYVENDTYQNRLMNRVNHKYRPAQ